MSRPYLLSKKDLVYDNIGFDIYDAEVLSNLEDLEEAEEPDTTEKDDNSMSTENDKEDKENDDKTQIVKPENNYIGTIEIPKINLKKGFVSPNSKYNNIKYNVTIIDGFDYPDVEKGNFILAAHSGTARISFFRDLYKLQTGDTVKITYKNKVYTYKITNIYTQKKQGYLTIYRNANKTTLSLITCTKDSDTLQTVYVAELV